MAALVTSSVHSEDNWTGPDKTGHAEWSALYGVMASAYVNEPGNWNWKAFGLAMAPGVAKEIHDKYAGEKSGFSYKDLAADAVGASLGVAAGQQTIVRLMHRKDETRVLLSWKF